MPATTSSLCYSNHFESDLFKSVDQNSCKVANNIYSSLNGVLNDLFFSTTLDDILKIRSIFAWLSFVDVEKFEFSDSRNAKPCEMLCSLKYGGSYAEAFKSLLGHVGIKAVCITGWAKGNNYLTSSLKDLPNHSWNAVEIESKWYLVDCYWSKSISENGEPEIDNFYFLNDPRKMIYSHYPKSPWWQLLPEPLTFESFIALPAIKPEFFKFKLSLMDVNQPRVTEVGKEITTVLHPGNVFFKYEILEVGNKKAANHELKQYVFDDHTNDKVNYYFRAPRNGLFILKIFASNVNYNVPHKCVIYKLVVELPFESEIHHHSDPFPSSTDASWGCRKPYLISPCINSSVFYVKEEQFNFSINSSSGNIFFIRTSATVSASVPSITYAEAGAKIIINIGMGSIRECGVDLYIGDIENSKKVNFVGQFLIYFLGDLYQKNLSKSVLLSNKGSHKIAKDLVTSHSEDMHRVRDIFWLLTKEELCSLKDQSHQLTLEKLKSGYITYAHAFENLCRSIGYCSVTVTGIVGGIQFKVNGKYQNQYEHSWNAVYVDDSWHLVDCQLAAGSAHHIDEFYFMPDPTKFIHTHFPFDSKWQLLEPPISIENFHRLVHFSPAYFKNNLLLIEPLENYLEVDTEIDVILKQDLLNINTTFSFSFTFQGNAVTECNSYIMQCMKDGLISFKVRFPMKGLYSFVLYIEVADNEDGHTVEEVCKFTIKYVNDEYKFTPFPTCGSCWGYTHFAMQNGIKCFPEAPMIRTYDGIASISIVGPLNLTLKIEFTTQAGHKVEHFGLIRKLGANIEIMVRCPEVGEYCLKIYAKCHEVDFYYNLALQILVELPDIPLVNSIECWNLMTALPYGFLGPQPNNIFFGIVCFSHPDPYVELTENVIGISFLDKLNLNLSCKLFKAPSSESNCDLSTYVLKQRINCRNNFLVTLPEKGIYVFQLYGSDKPDDMLNVYNIMLNCHNVTNRVFEFPKQLHFWNGFLHQPLRRYLCKLRDNIVIFKLNIPTARQVHLVVKEKFLPFIQQKCGVWYLYLELSDLSTCCKVEICGCLNESTSQVLLEYIVI